MQAQKSAAFTQAFAADLLYLTDLSLKSFKYLQVEQSDDGLNESVTSG